MYMRLLYYFEGEEEEKINEAAQALSWNKTMLNNLHLKQNETSPKWFSQMFLPNAFPQNIKHSVHWTIQD